MSTLIGIKEFRHSLSTVADAVEEGKSFVVMRRSKPCFTVRPFEPDETDEGIDLKGWKTIMDFTEGGKKKGIPAKKLFKAMKEYIEKNGKVV